MGICLLLFIPSFDYEFPEASTTSLFISVYHSDSQIFTDISSEVCDTTLDSIYLGFMRHWIKLTS